MIYFWLELNEQNWFGLVLLCAVQTVKAGRERKMRQIVVIGRLRGRPDDRAVTSDGLQREKQYVYGPHFESRIFIILFVSTCLLCKDFTKKV